MVPLTPKTASRARLTWRWVPNGRAERNDWWDGRPYSWEAHARRLLALQDRGQISELEVEFLTRQGWTGRHKVGVCG